MVDKQKLVVASDGHERLSSTTAWFFGAPNITTDDPDGRQPFILNIAGFPDEKGLHYERIDFA